MKAGTKEGAPSVEKEEPSAAKSDGDLKLLTTLYGNNSFKILLRLYFHRVIIDVVHLVVGGFYLSRVNPSKNMKPTYLVVRGAVSLLTVPISIAADSLGSKVSLKLIALKTIGSVFTLIRFSWLIYGTVLLSTVPLDGGCDKPCSWAVVGSVAVDWAWAITTTCATLCPFCWAMMDQCSTCMFLIYVAIRKGRNEKNPSPANVT